MRSRKGSISTGSNECCQWPCAERTGPRHHHANSCAQLGHLQLLPWHTISFSFSPPLAAGTSGAADEGPLLAMDMRSGGSPAGRIGPSGAKQDVLASMHAAAPHLSHLISTDRGRRFDRPVEDDRSVLCSLPRPPGKRFVWAKFLAQARGLSERGAGVPVAAGQPEQRCCGVGECTRAASSPRTLQS